jgi:tetratricopeptide (TPR) repeat protein
LETRRALREELAELDYKYLGTIYQGGKEEAALIEGIKKYPHSVGLYSAYMELLAKAGRKEEAWNAYERARDLYFTQVDRSEIPTLPGISQTIKPGPISPAVVAFPWYIYLLQEGKDDELRRLEDRLREACPKTTTEIKDLLLPRAVAEFRSSRYAAAVRSLEICLQEKLGNEAFIASALAGSLRALGQRKEAIKWYRRAVEISGVDPSLLSEFLCLVVEEQGVNGLQRELPNYDLTKLKFDVRRNATLNCFFAWAALATGDNKAAFENSAQGAAWLQIAGQQVTLPEENTLVCVVILLIVSEKLGDQRSVQLADAVKRFFPAQRVNTLRAIFSLPKRK